MNDATLKTKDVDEASFFWTKDDKFSLLDVETVDSYGRTIVWFVFKPLVSAEEVDKIKSDYRFGKCLVEPRKYSSRRSEIKAIIREKCSSMRGERRPFPPRRED